VAACIAMGIIAVGLLIVMIGSLFLEKETRLKRFEAYDYYKQVKQRERTKKK